MKYLVAILSLGLFFTTSSALAADQLGCSTSTECFLDCCPDGNPVCAQICRNTCASRPGTCPGHYFYCPYNTFIAELNWLEVTNLGSAQASVTLNYFDSNGNTVAESQSFELDALERRDFDIHRIIGPSRFGQVILGLDGDLDLLLGNVSYYENIGGVFSQSVSRQCEKRARVLQ